MIGRACATHERNEKYIQNISLKTWEEETIWKTLSHSGGLTILVKWILQI
jgi:hypothetical protein